jgi:hypothetical protein
MKEDAPLVSVPAQVVNMSPRQDRSWKLVFETRELSGDEVKVLADNFQGEGWLLFKPNGEIAVAEVPAEKADAGMKTQAQRLRGAIMVLWRQKGGKGDPEAFYRTTTEKLIEFVKSQLIKED